MKKEQDYIRDIAEIRSMMERSSKFLSLSGWAGIMAGIYALAGAYIAYSFLNFNPDEIYYDAGNVTFSLWNIIILALLILIFALGTAVFLSYKRAAKREEKLWNPTSRRLLINITVPFIVSGILILILISKGLIGLIAPFSLLFYGLALYYASRYTYEEVKILGLVEISLGLLGSWFIGYGLFFWALGFGVAHIIYGIYMHYKYEK